MLEGGEGRGCRSSWGGVAKQSVHRVSPSCTYGVPYIFHIYYPMCIKVHGELS